MCELIRNFFQVCLKCYLSIVILDKPLLATSATISQEKQENKTRENTGQKNRYICIQGTQR